jgi:DNA-binding MarR family transcriptional regulator
MANPTPQQVSSTVAQLMPNIIRGVQLDFFLKRRVTQTQLLMMLAIHAYSRCTMGTLARSMHVSMPTVSGVVDRLARAGFIRRFPHPEDRRQVLVELTAKGHTFIRDFQGIIRRRWEEVLRTLAPRELETFHGVIQKLQTILQAHR